MTKTATAKTSTGLTVFVKKDSYTWLWNIVYEDGMKYAGPYKTKREAVERMNKLTKSN
jgi:hypothetical protein